MNPAMSAPGSWASPISAADAVRGRRSLSACAFAGDEVWWSEGRPDEGGRVTVCARAADGSGPVRELLPAPQNARTRVHEYGGVSFLPVPAAGSADQHAGAGFDLAFVEFTDQRLYRLPGRHGADGGGERSGDAGGVPDGDGADVPHGGGDHGVGGHAALGAGAPVPLVPAPDRPCGLRWADLSLDARRSRILAVREEHRGDGTYGTVQRSIVAIPLDGSAAENPSAIVELASGADFYAAPRLDPAGERLLYLSWNHPDMPWDAAELHLVTLDPSGGPSTDRVIRGGGGVSAADPGFLTAGADKGSVLAMSDEGGWWRPLVIDATGTGRWRSDLDAEFAGPAWTLGHRGWAELPGGRLMVIAGGIPGMLRGDGSVDPLDPGWTTCSDLRADASGRVALVVGGDTVTARVCVLRSNGTTWHATDLRLAADPDIDIPPAYRPPARAITVAGVHAVVYPPTNPDHPDALDAAGRQTGAGTAAESSGRGFTAPYLMVVHGGPTSQFSRLPSATTAFFTSRGIGVIGLDYAGSTGYGRAYRERLRHAWGQADVADAANVARALLADPAAGVGSVVIQGGSAGGWTVLSALTAAPEVLGGDSPFTAGISLYGVADARALAEGTHDFEARYTDSLLGPDPRSWFAASPLAHVDRLATPVLLLQGGQDPIVTPDQAEAFRAAAAERGVPHTLIVFPDESHGFRAAQAQIRTLEAQLSFMGQVLGFDTPGVPPLELTSGRSDGSGGSSGQTE